MNEYYEVWNVLTIFDTTPCNHTQLELLYTLCNMRTNKKENLMILLIKELLQKFYLEAKTNYKDFAKFIIDHPHSEFDVSQINLEETSQSISRFNSCCDLSSSNIVEDNSSTVKFAVLKLDTIVTEQSIPEKLKEICSVLLLVTVAKKGCFSDSFWKRCRSEMSSDAYNNYDSDFFENLWSEIKEFINEKNMEDILNTFKINIPSTYHQVLATVSGISWAGLTGLITIREAYSTHPFFPWSQIEDMFKEEVPLVAEAMKLIEKNPFYGYSNDDRIERGNFSMMLYSAKQVLIQLDGHRDLMANISVVTKPVNFSNIEKIINSFKSQNLAHKRKSKILPKTDSTLLPIMWSNNSVFKSSSRRKS